MSSNVRATKRVVAAAAGFGMVAAGFAGAASASASTTHHGPSAAARAAQAQRQAAFNRIHRDITGPPSAPSTVSTTTSGPITTTTALLGDSVSVASPSITVSDPGVIPSGDRITLTLGGPDYGVNSHETFDTTKTPVVTVSGSALAGAVTVTGTTISFTITKDTTATPATFTVSGVYLTGTTGAQAGGLYVETTATHLGTPVGSPPVAPTVTDATVAPVGYATVTDLLPAYYGQTAPDTAAKLFDAVANSGVTSVVLASDSEPQDAESANYLEDNVPGPQSGILLTDPTTLSPAVTSTFAAYPSIANVYIVGGTSVISAGIEAQLDTEFGATHVIRIAGETQYDTNSAVINYVDNSLGGNGTPDVEIDYSSNSLYNDTTGLSSPTTTTTEGSVSTAIVVSGSIDSYQDGIVSGPLSEDYDMPVILTSPTGLSAEARSLLVQGGYKQVILLGGPAAVSDTVVTQLTTPVASDGAGVDVFRIAGTDASDTSQLFARFLVSDELPGNVPGSNIGMYLTDDDAANGGVLIARGSGFQDALAAGPYAGEDAYSPILLTENATTLGAPLTSYLKLVGENYVYSVEAIGGPLSVTPDVQSAAIAAEVSGFDQNPTP